MKSLPGLMLGLVLLIPAAGAQAACPGEHLVTTLGGKYAAVDPSAFRTLNRALAGGDTERVEALVEEGRVVRLPDGKRACVIHRTYHTSRIQIRLEEDGGEKYWVHKSSVSG